MSDEPDLRASPLAARHASLGATMAPFAGWSMPIRYGSIADEHRAVREAVGVFDVSHLGTVTVTGPDALDVVAASFTNDPARLADGASQYTLCCADDGGIIDDLIVYRLGPEQWFAVPNAANTAAVTATLQAAAADRDAEVADVGAQWAVLAVQGPDALELVDRVLASRGTGDRAASATPHLGVTVCTLQADADVDAVTGADRLVLARTGYTGERGVELLVPAPAAPALFDALLEAGASPCGLGARDTLRLEVGYPLHGNELSREVDPYTARLGWAVKLDREDEPRDFPGAAALRAMRAAGPSRRLLGLRVEGRRPARAGMPVLDGDVAIGTVTSGTVSPTLGTVIALARLPVELEPGHRVRVDIRGQQVDAEVVRPPFVARDPSA